jgi:MYXO-CTERM domain-containing protein
MRSERSKRGAGQRRGLGLALASVATFALMPAPALAHFVLQAPASWSVDSQTSGAPEKLGPCGNEGTPVPAVDDAGRTVITAFQSGQTITVTIKEVVPHPGHYRIALSLQGAINGDKVQADFPPDPVVTMGPTNSGSMVCPNAAMAACGSVPIQTPPVFPVLADNVFEHCQPFAGPQSVQITLPPGVTCTKCALQVLEFMSDHGLNPQGGCFYHHCANISIQGTTVPVDGGAGADSSAGGADGSASSGSASTGSASSGAASTGTGTGTGTMSSGSAASSGSGASGSAPSSGASSSGSTMGGSGGGGLPPAMGASGCGCSVPSRSTPSLIGLAGIFAVAGFVRRRRRHQ